MPTNFHPSVSLASDPEAWARRINSRWLVHDGLRTSASEYLDHLAATDPERLRASCEDARKLVRHGAPDEDPKPRFYGGLFRRATAAEAARFLGRHPFTLALVPSLTAEAGLPALLDQVGESTRDKIRRLRTELEALTPFEPPG